MNKKTQQAILQMVQAHPGEWGWYQIDRALSIKGIVGVNVVEAMTALKNKGLVTADGDAQRASTRYSLTRAGKAALSGSV